MGLVVVSSPPFIMKIRFSGSHVTYLLRNICHQYIFWSQCNVIWWSVNCDETLGMWYYTNFYYRYTMLQFLLYNALSAFLSLPSTSHWAIFVHQYLFISFNYYLLLTQAQQCTVCLLMHSLLTYAQHTYLRAAFLYSI